MTPCNDLCPDDHRRCALPIGHVGYHRTADGKAGWYVNRELMAEMKREAAAKGALGPPVMVHSTRG